MYKIKSYGKINLSLDVLNLREDGYHNIDTIMQLIDLNDILIVSLREDNILNIYCDDINVPIDKRNLVYKAWKLLKPYRKGFYGLNICIEKRIPIAAGLAGGSSNAAYFMKLLNDIWNLNLTKEQLQEIGVNIGADVPFFFEEGTVRAEGIGNIFTKLKDFKNINTIIINNGCKVDTTYVYKNIKNSIESRIEKCIETISSSNPFIKENYYNTMMGVSGALCPDIYSIIDTLYEHGAKVALMSGSGSTVFGLYDNSRDFNNSYEKLKTKYKFVYKAKTI